MKIIEIEGVGPMYAEALGKADVQTTDDLLERGAYPAGRRALAEASGLTKEQILEWVNRADLMRLDGVGSEYSDLLEAAGVDSPIELAHRNAANLAAKIVEYVTAHPNIVRRVPTEPVIAGWIEQAKTMERAVFHSDSAAPAMAADEPAMAPMAEPEPDAMAADEPAMAAAADPMPMADPMPAPPPPSTAPAAWASTSELRGEGWWAKVKRFFGR